VAFESLALDEVVAFTAAGNARSRRVMEKLRMEPIPVTFEHPAVPVGNPLRTHVLYRLTRDTWKREHTASG
jgi:RimJ/RimL family protein N-acetyltransferase